MPKFFLKISFCMVCLSIIIGGQTLANDKHHLTADGPYITYCPDGRVRVVSVSLEGIVSDTVYASDSAFLASCPFVVTSHDGKHRFQVSLHSFERPQWKCPQPDKIFVMSDPHGDLDCVVSLLQAGGVIDSGYRWSFGTNRLVVIGDVFDRGNDETQILWLLYKLEHEASQAGGGVDFLLGNHEAMVLMNDLRYSKDKYKLLAEKLCMEFPQLLSRSTELGYWLTTRNTMQIVGNNLFVHAGVSGKMLDLDLSIPTVNEQVSHGLYLGKAQRRAESPLTYFLFGSSGPLWYRGMVLDVPKYNPIAADTLQMVLDRYGVDRVIVGHTVFDDIQSLHQAKVIAVNVDNRKNRKHGKGRGIIIEKDSISVIYDDASRRKCLSYDITSHLHGNGVP